MDLIVVIPVYNEAGAIGAVVQEWCATLDQQQLAYRLLLINDGSTDDSAQRIRELQTRFANVVYLEQSNRGHGQTCIDGYRYALQHGAQWVFQIDSDGQCDPQYFGAFWQHKAAPVVLGQRVRREDGIARVVISLFTRLAVLAATGVPVRDANVPYRLMRGDVVALAVKQFPADFYLANILVAVILQKGLQGRLQYLPIGFRKRVAGQPSVRWARFATLGWQLFRSLLKYRGFVHERANEIRASGN